MAFEAIDDLLQAAPADPAWESFHENSKLSRHERHSIFALPPSDATRGSRHEPAADRQAVS